MRPTTIPLRSHSYSLDCHNHQEACRPRRWSNDASITTHRRLNRRRSCDASTATASFPFILSRSTRMIDLRGTSTASMQGVQKQMARAGRSAGIYQEVLTGSNVWTGTKTCDHVTLSTARTNLVHIPPTINAWQTTTLRATSSFG